MTRLETEDQAIKMTRRGTGGQVIKMIKGTEDHVHVVKITEKGTENQ
jgi:hypothetical protein